MSKIPVFDTVAETYAFSFRHYLKLFSVTWLPVLIATVASFYVTRNFFPQYIEFMKEQMAAPPGTLPPNPFAAMPMMSRVWLLDIAMLFFVVMMAVGITKEVLGVREAPRFVYFRFGADELRLLAGFAGVMLLIFVAVVGASIIAGIIAAVAMAGSAPHDPAAAGGMIARIILPIMLVIYLIGFYFVVRLTFFLAPVVVAEKQIGVGRSWALSSGNFWRIFAIGLLIWIPLLIAELIFFGIVMGPSIAEAMANGPHVPQQFVIALMEAEAAKMPYMLLLLFFVSPILYGVLLAPAAFAYKAVENKAAV